jgi:putative PEP-CTERM system TPR-repeat lipoprotein
MMQRILKTRSLLRAIGLACALSSGAAHADVQALRFYEDAISRFNAGDARGALIQLRNALQRDPTQLPARVLMGKVLLESGAAAAAEEEFDKAVKLGADPALVALPLAQARNLQGKHALVVEQLRPPAYPRSVQADLWVELAKARYWTGDTQGAEIALDEALGEVAGHEGAMLTRARIEIGAGELERAARVLADLQSLNPRSGEASRLLGTVRHAQGDFAAALGHYRKALELVPGDPGARLGESLALLDGGDAMGAAERLADMRSDMPYALEPHYFHARALARLGKTSEARAALDQAAEMVGKVTPADLGDDRTQLRLAANVKLASGEFEGAYSFLTRYLELEPGDAAANKQLARLLVRLDKAGDAARLLARLRVHHPDDPEILVMLGDVNTAMRDYAGAERYYQFAQERLAATPELVNRIGLARLRQGQTDAAIDVLQDLVADEPLAHMETSVFLGVLYLGAGRVDEAAEIAARVIAQDPGNLVARNLSALAAIAGGDRAAGRTELESIVGSNPEFRPAQINLVKLDMLEGRFEPADRRIAALLAEMPSDVSALHEAARLAIARGQPGAAIERLEQVREIDPRAVKPLVDLANLYLRQGDMAKAVQVAIDLERQVPQSLDAKTSLARIQLTRGETAVALSLLHEAGRLAGNRVAQLVDVARLQAQAGAAEAAEANLRKALESDPESRVARRELAILMTRQGRAGEAVGLLETAMDSVPGDVSLLALLADIKMSQGRADEAIALYESARKIQDGAELTAKLYRARRTRGQEELAFAELVESHRQRPDEPLLIRLLADELHARGESSEAIRLYRRLVELRPDSMVAYNNLANLLLPVDAEDALRAALRAHELAPDNASVLDTLGWTLVQLGELERGLAYLREAVARNSRSPTLRYHLAVALDEYGNKVEARRELKKALELPGPFPAREQALQRLERLGLGG